MIPLDIFADPVCPWCLIGKANLDRALEARPGHPFVLAWHPFRLDPTMPANGGTMRPVHLIIPARSVLAAEAPAAVAAGNVEVREREGERGRLQLASQPATGLPVLPVQPPASSPASADHPSPPSLPPSPPSTPTGLGGGRL